jgi:hypothetical protein
MNPFEAVTAFWTAQGNALMNAQTQMAEGMKAMMSGTLPAMPGAATDLTAASADLATAQQSVMDLWAAATATAGTLASELPKHLAGNAQDASLEAMFLKVADPQAWLAGAGDLAGALDRVSEGPRFADLWEIERRYLRVLKAWMAVRQCSGAHNAVVLQAWMQAAQTFRDELAGKAGAEAQMADGKAILALWTETANRALLETQSSDMFLHTQTAMVRATTELNLAQQNLTEHFGKQYGFPTRTEMDDVHRTVTELRREVRMMRRMLTEAAPARPGARRARARSGAVPGAAS